MAKTWFQHDMNASKKDGLSTILEMKDGDALYGKYWLLQEHLYFSQIHKDEISETIRINESTLVKVLKTNRKRLPNILQTFHECLGIVSQTSHERLYNVCEITMPKSLIYIRNRKLKPDNKSKSKVNIKENKSKYKERTYKTSYWYYLKLVIEGYRCILNDPKVLKEQEEFYPNIDIELSLKKSIKNFWGTKAGWKNKKSKRTKEINMKTTLLNNLEKNRVWKNKSNNQENENHKVDW